MCSRKSLLRYPTRIRRPPAGGGDGANAAAAADAVARAAAEAATARKEAGGSGRRTAREGSRFESWRADRSSVEGRHGSAMER